MRLKRWIAAGMAAVMVTSNIGVSFERPVYAASTEELITVTEVAEEYNNGASTVINAIGGRVFQEFTAYCISNQVPVLGTMFFFMADPGQRSTMQANANITKIVGLATNIQNEVNALQNQINTLTNKVEELDAKTDFLHAADNIEDITDKYTALWENYSKLLQKIEELSKLEVGSEEYNTLYLKLYGEVYAEDETLEEKEQEEGLYIEFMKRLEQLYTSGSIQFENDLLNLDKNIYSSKQVGTTKCYLTAFEDYLREIYPFEHQIANGMYTAAMLCQNYQLRIFTLYKEYSVYQDMKKGKFKSGELIPEDYFKDKKNELINNMNNQIIGAGIDRLMVTEISEDWENGDIMPETYMRTVSINGQQVECYYVRDNKTLDYYLITRVAESLNVQVETFRVLNDTMYRPSGYLDAIYTDDGKYKLISGLQVAKWAESVQNPLDFLRKQLLDAKGNDKLSQQANAFLLRVDESVPSKFNGYWNMALQSATQFNYADAGKFVTATNSKNAYNDKTTKYLRIYKNVTNSSIELQNNMIKAYSSADLNNREISLTDGQILDMSVVQTNPTNIKIIASGACKIIGNKNITLQNSQLILSTDKEVLVENLNMKAKQFNDACVEASVKDAKLVLIGENTFVGNGVIPDEKELYYYIRKENNPVGASSGLVVRTGASLTITSQNQGSGIFNGSSGGAGICPVGNLVIDKAKIIANGSKSDKNKIRYNPGNLGEMIIYNGYAVGAGIGACDSYIDKQNIDDTKPFTYSSYGKVTIKDSDVAAKGVIINESEASKHIPKSTDKGLQSCDIGGIVYIYGRSLYKRVHVKFDISNSYINLENVLVDRGDITFRGENIFEKELYTIKADTYGSDGVTDDGISIAFEGKDGKKDAVALKGFGESKGENTIKVVGSSYGDTLKNIYVKTNSSDKWYAKKIEVHSLLAGKTESAIVGRWIGKEETKLSTSESAYVITIKTSGDKNAGTDADIYLSLTDENGYTTSERELSCFSNAKNAFEKNDEMEVWFADSKLGKIKTVNLKSDDSGSGSDWKVESISVRKEKGTEDSFTIKPNQWLTKKNETIYFGRNSGETGVFKFTIKTTSNKKKAGTDSNIQIRLHGKKNGKKVSTSYINIGEYVDHYCSSGGNHFEEGDEDWAIVPYSLQDIGGLGTIESIEIKKDNKGIGPDWHLEYISVEEILADGVKAQRVIFEVNDWISDDTYQFTGSSYSNHTGIQADINAQIIEEISNSESSDYTVQVEKSFELNGELIQLLKARDIKLTIEIKDGDVVKYAFVLDGSRLEKIQNLDLDIGFNKLDDATILKIKNPKEVLQGVKLRLYKTQLQLADGDESTVDFYVKNAEGKWEKIKTLFNSGEATKEIELDTIDSEFMVSVKETQAEQESEETITDETEEISKESTTEEMDDAENADTPQTGDKSTAIPFGIMLMIVVVLVMTFGKKNGCKEK